MIEINLTKKNDLQFQDLEIGEYFTYDNKVYCKIQTLVSKGLVYNCFWFNAGVLDYCELAKNVSLLKDIVLNCVEV